MICGMPSCKSFAALEIRLQRGEAGSCLWIPVMIQMCRLRNREEKEA
jgi:hypothetical protein